MNQLWVRNISGGYDLTDDVEGLNWSNVNPGGDERAGFTYKRSWFAENPEIAKGNVIRIGWGLDVLWQGRIEEHDRGGEASEEIQVTAYGLGARLKDNTMREIYVGRDMSEWGDVSNNRQSQLLSAGYKPSAGTHDVDATNGYPALRLSIADLQNAAPPYAIAEAWLDTAGIELDSVTFGSYEDKSSAGPPLAAPWQIFMHLAASDTGTSNVATPNLAGTLPAAGAGSVTSTGGIVRAFAFLQMFYNAASTSSHEFSAFFKNLAWFGKHGLTKRGAAPDQGFYASDIVANVISRVAGIVARRIDPQTYVFLNASFRTAKKHEDVIAEINQYEGCNWGTWGPDSPLDTSTSGQFDYTNPDYSTQHWFATRAELDDIDLHSELSTLYDQVDVHYTDTSGASRTVRRTAVVPDLIAAGMSPRTYDLEAGTQAPAEAATLGDSFLALSGGFAPARGSISVVAPVRHFQRGPLPPVYLRADGSNLRIPDVLPSTTLFDLSSTPDRRTTFPMKRVTVDAAGSKITATVELDQTNDLLSVLQARLTQANELAIG